MQVDNDLVKKMRIEVLQAITAIALRNGLNVKQQNNITYSSTDFNIKYTFSDADINLAKVEFGKKCWKYGFSASDYGRSFIYKDKVIIITGINTRAPKYPIQYSANGKSMKCAPEFMKIMIQGAD